MKFILTESQFKSLMEGKRPDIYDTFGLDSSFLKRVESILKEKDMINLSKYFFKRVVTNPKYFNTVNLEPGNEEYEKRMEELVKLKDILQNKKSCYKILEKVKEDIDLLPNKGLKMVVDNENKYSLLNRLDTHYTAKAYLLTKLLFDEIELKTMNKLEDLSDSKIKEFLKYIMNDSYVDDVSEYLHNLLEENKTFKHYFFDSIERSRETGYKIEHEVLDVLRGKYGPDNVIEFSNDFGFVDYFGIDGILIIDNVAHPIQISSKLKPNPKIFKYSSEYCKPIGFYKEKGKIIKYEPQ